MCVFAKRPVRGGPPELVPQMEQRPAVGDFKAVSSAFRFFPLPHDARLFDDKTGVLFLGRR